MKRSRKKSSMSGKDTHGTSWLDGWGKNRKKVARLERRRRERKAQKDEGYAKGGYVTPSGDPQKPYILSEGYVITSKDVPQEYIDALKKMNGGGEVVTAPVQDCLFFWGSHGCDLPADGHEVHQCSYVIYDDDMDPADILICCQYNEADDRVRHNLTDSVEPEWGEWSYYGHGWYMDPKNP